MRTLFLTVILGFIPTLASAQTFNANPLEASARFQPSRLAEGQTAEVFIDMKLAEPYHAYVDKFKLVVASPDDLKISDMQVSPVVSFMDVFSKKMREGIEKTGKGHAIIEIPKGFKSGSYKAKLDLTYQACSKENCLFPKTISIEAPFEVSSDPTQRPAMMAGDQAPIIASTDFEHAIGQSFWLAIAVVFGMGLITSLTPCIYPMIPITLAVLGARTKDQSKLKSFTLSLVYVLGIAVTYSILGVAAAKTGALFGSLLGNIYVVSAIAILFVAMALGMYGVYEIQPPAFIRNRLGTAQTGSGYPGAFATGLLAGIVASPCVGPVLVSVLTYIAQTQNVFLGFTLLFSFAMGMGVLFLVLGTSSSLLSKMPKAGPWMDLTKFIFGSIMVGMALYYVKPVYPEWLFKTLVGVAIVLIASGFGAFESGPTLSTRTRLRKGLMLTALVVGLAFTVVGILAKAGIPLAGFLAPKESSSEKPKLAWQPYSDEALKIALNEKKPVIIDFYADWCVACKELEHETFPDPRVRALSEKFVLLKIDATEDFPGLDKLKQTYTVLGLPTMIFYDQKGDYRKELTLTGFENAESFLARMNRAL